MPRCRGCLTRRVADESAPPRSRCLSNAWDRMTRFLRNVPVCEIRMSQLRTPIHRSNRSVRGVSARWYPAEFDRKDRVHRSILALRCAPEMQARRNAAGVVSLTAPQGPRSPAVCGGTAPAGRCNARTPRVSVRHSAPAHPAANRYKLFGFRDAKPPLQAKIILRPSVPDMTGLIQNESIPARNNPQFEGFPSSRTEDLFA